MVPRACVSASAERPVVRGAEVVEHLGQHRDGPVVVEVDEDAHQYRFEEDRARDRYLAGQGLRAMRVTEQSLRDEAALREEVRRAARIVR